MTSLKIYHIFHEKPRVHSKTVHATISFALEGSKKQVNSRKQDLFPKLCLYKNSNENINEHEFYVMIISTYYRLLPRPIFMQPYANGMIIDLLYTESDCKQIMSKGLDIYTLTCTQFYWTHTSRNLSGYLPNFWYSNEILLLRIWTHHQWISQQLGRIFMLIILLNLTDMLIY